MRAILFLLLFAAAAGRAQTQVPENLKPPPSEAVLLKAVGKGRQIYACNVKDGKFAWTLERPQADLFDARGNVIGRHYQGPTWEASDGSKVTGQLLQQANAPRPGAIPWLLLKAKSNAGAGIFGQGDLHPTTQHGERRGPRALGRLRPRAHQRRGSNRISG